MNPVKPSILVVDDDPEVCLALEILLEGEGFKITTLHQPDALTSLIHEREFDVILLDVHFSPGQIERREGLQWLSFLQQHAPDTPVIIITAYGDVDLAVQALKSGAVDFIQKPWRNEKLLATIHSALQLRHSRLEIRRLRERQKHITEVTLGPHERLVGISPAMNEIRRTIHKVAASDASVLILGETGTGKELVARAIHRASHRRDEIFVSVDMGAVTGTLFESELFGFVKGAFTDAREDRPGRFEVASGGTLFLDEIGNLPLPLQAKLLTVIEKREVTRLGSNRPIPVDIRLICASNRDLYQMVEDGEFRRDLLYRINTVEIRIPPLRERPEDIPLLIEYFMETIAAKYGKEPLKVSPERIRQLQGYAWPGNVRELRNLVERAIIMYDERLLSPVADRVSGEPERIHDEEPVNILEGSLNLARLEREAIQRAIQKHKGNLSRAARELGISRQALYRRMVKYGLG